ncbi:MAG: ABC transporter ATP-binding protein [Ignavibacteriales bacterium]|nr:ABC transporter ATP-binding protein [Ignavibacteriales bacterium]
MNVINLHNVSKIFSIPHERKRTLFHWLSSLGKGRYDFEPLFALKDINLQIERGEFVGIIGRNGCGKSTLLKIISRIYPPSTGTAKVQGSIFPLLELGVGFQPEFSCKENVYLYGSTLGFTRKQLRARLESIIAFAELERFIDAKLSTLSTGMIVRLAFAIAVQSQASIYLVDEGLAVGDNVFKEKCRNEFKRLKEEGRTLLFVSHDMLEIQTFCDRVVVMTDGQIINTGGAAEMIQFYLENKHKSPS